MRKIPFPPNERGIAMIIVLLIVMGLALLASGVVLITTTEVFVTRNEAFGKEALYAAEAGLKHAEMLMQSLNSRDQITMMYQKSGAQTGVPSYRGALIGYKFLDMNQSSQPWVTGQLDAGHRYELYVTNNDPTEKDTSGKPIEADGVFYVRCIGYANFGGGGVASGQASATAAAALPAARRMLEEEILLKAPLMEASPDAFGGGPGNTSIQRTY